MSFAKLPHSIFHSDIWKRSPHSHLRVYLALIHKAAWTERSWYDSRHQRHLKLHKGELITSRQKLAEFCRVSPKEARQALKSLAAAGLIESRGLPGEFTFVRIKDSEEGQVTGQVMGQVMGQVSSPASDSESMAYGDRLEPMGQVSGQVMGQVTGHKLRKKKESARGGKKEEDARAEAAAPPPPPSDPSSAIKDQVAAVLREAVAVWPPARIGNLHWAQQTWQTAAAENPDGVGAWCQVMRAAVLEAKDGYGDLAITNPRMVPTLQNFVSDGYYQAPKPKPLQGWRKPRFDPSSLEVDHEAERLKAAAAPAPVTTASSTPAPRPMKRLIDYYPEAPAPAVAAAPAQVPTMPSNPAPAQTRKGSMKAVGALMGSAAPKPRGCRCVDGMVLRDDATLNDVLGHSGDPHRGKIPCPDCSGKRQQVTAAHAVSTFLASPPPASSPAPL